MPQVSQTEWLNANMLRAYPLREDSGRVPTQNGMSIDSVLFPNALLADALLTVPLSDFSDGLIIYVSQLVTTPSLVSVTLSSTSSDSTSAPSTVTTVSVPVADSFYKSVSFRGQGDMDAVVGSVTFGDVESALESIPFGVYTFNPDQTWLEPRCIRPGLARVDSIRVIDSTGYETKRLRGDIRLKAGRNCRLSYNDQTKTITISADSTSKYNDECLCADGGGYVKTLNGVRVEAVTLKGSECIDVSVANGVISIKDICAKPCCGCAELEVANEKMDRVDTAEKQLTSYIASVEAFLTRMEQAFNESKALVDMTDETGETNNA